MAIFVKATGELTQLHEHLDKLQRLVRDIEALAAGSYPTAAELSDAPELENWSYAAHPVPCLTGEFYGHPKIRSGNFGRTSDLWVQAPSHGYARTLSRLYRLGPPLRPTGART